MTEKRYYSVDYDEQYYIFDSDVIRKGRVEEEAEYSYDVFANSMSSTEIIDKLNELTNENEQLKILLQNTSAQRDEFYHGARENANRVGELEKENEQLKQLLDLFASDICKVTELLDDNNIEYELYNDVENFIVKWGVRIE